MKKLIAAVISMVALSSCVFAPFSKSCNCPQPEETLTVHEYTELKLQQIAERAN